MSRREWSALWANIKNKPKYRRLSPRGRGALLTIWALAMDQDPEACWRSRQDLLDSLELDGFTAADLDELIAGRWVDVAPDGAHTVHDWSDHQRGAFVSAHRQGEAERKAAERAREKESGKERERLDKTIQEHPDMSGQHANSRSAPPERLVIQ